MKELTSFERYIRNQIKKQKETNDQKILDEMLMQMKQKHEQQHQEKVSEAKATLNLLIQ